MRRRRPLAPIIKVLLLATILMLVAVSSVLGLTSPESEASGITLSSSVQVSFPTSMTFKMRAQSDAAITRLRLHYVVNQRNYATVVSEGWAQFSPSLSVDTQWLWDMRKSSLPPGAQVEYWWAAGDATGKSAETSHATVSFDDDRYKWQVITAEPVTLLWYNGSSSFAGALLDAARQGLQRIVADTGATPKGRVRIYIYASAQDLQGAQLFAQQWEGGAAFTAFDTIAIGVSPADLAYGRRAVPHELTHWIVGQITFNNYGAGLPIWLEEGLATYGEGTLSPDYQAALDFAIQNNRLISIRSLSSPFSAIPEEAYISYAESNSVVTFLIKAYGRDKMDQLLEVFCQGSTYDEALRQVYGFDQDGLDGLWRQSLGIRSVFDRQRELAATAVPVLVSVN